MAGVAFVLSLILHAAVVPPVLQRITNQNEVPESSPTPKRVEVVMKPLPQPPPKKKAKVAKPKGVEKPKPAPKVLANLPVPRAKALPNTFVTQVVKVKPNQLNSKRVETVSHVPDPVKPPEVKGVKEATAAITPTPAPRPEPAYTPPPPAPKGPTLDAETTYAPKPHIPRSLLTKASENQVRLRFIIAPDGSFQVVLVTSSGIPELDQAALDTCRSWHWKPALRDGVPVTRVVNQRIDFVVI